MIKITVTIQYRYNKGFSNIRQDIERCLFDACHNKGINYWNVRDPELGQFSFMGIEERSSSNVKTDSNMLKRNFSPFDRVLGSEPLHSTLGFSLMEGSNAELCTKEFEIDFYVYPIRLSANDFMKIMKNICFHNPKVVILQYENLDELECEHSEALKKQNDKSKVSSVTQMSVSNSNLINDSNVDIHLITITYYVNVVGSKFSHPGGDMNYRFDIDNQIDFIAREFLESTRVFKSITVKYIRDYTNMTKEFSLVLKIYSPSKRSEGVKVDIVNEFNGIFEKSSRNNCMTILDDVAYFSRYKLTYQSEIDAERSYALLSKTPTISMKRDYFGILEESSYDFSSKHDLKLMSTKVATASEPDAKNDSGGNKKNDSTVGNSKGSTADVSEIYNIPVFPQYDNMRAKEIIHAGLRHAQKLSKTTASSLPSYTSPRSITVSANGISLADTKDKNISMFSSYHSELIRLIQPLVDAHIALFDTCMIAIKEKNYSKALRRACTSMHEDAFKIIKILCEFKEKLCFEINEQAGDNNWAAIHHAASKGNVSVYEFLISKGANVKLLDKKGKSAESLLSDFLSRSNTIKVVMPKSSH